MGVDKMVASGKAKLDPLKKNISVAVGVYIYYTLGKSEDLPKL